MRPLGGEPQGDGGADAARRAGNQRNLAGEPAGRGACACILGQAVTASSDSCTEILPSSASGGRFG
jgi:hypothetical protein